MKTGIEGRRDEGSESARWRPAARGGALALIGLVLVSLSGGSAAHRLGHGHGEDHHDPLARHSTAPERVRALIDRYHVDGDDHVLDQGWALLDGALDSDTTTPATLLAAAWLAQAGHDFEGAQGYLRHVLLLRPDHGEAWLLRASVALVQGDPATAREACGRTMLTVPVVVTAACYARVDAHDGTVEDVARAYRRLSATLSAQAPERADLLGWLHGVAADLAARGGLESSADRHYLAALELTPTVTVRTGYADLLLATGRPQRVLTLIGPEHTAPSLVMRRVMARMMLGAGPSRTRLKEIGRRFRGWIAGDDMRHAREMALFYLHVEPDPPLAYELAQRNYRAQREPEDRALLCDAARRVGQTIALGCDGGELPMMRAVSSIHGH